MFIANLPNLRKYSYQGEDRSIVTKYLLKPYWWSNFVKIFPEWFAPNLVTLTGFFFIVVNLLTLLYYDPYLNNPNVPSWTIYSYAFGLFMYQTFDAVDGMQARKTGQSGPLGELFDHCVDALNTSLSALIFGSVTKMGYSWMFLIAQFGVLANFYISTWEEYHTHILFLSEFSGPVEGILMIVVLYLVTAHFGLEIWTTSWASIDLASFLPESVIRLFAYAGFLEPVGVDKVVSAPVDLDASVVYVVLGVALLYFNISSAYANVKRVYKKDDSGTYLEKSHQAIKGLVPFALYYLSVFVFAIVSSPYLFSNFGSFVPFVLQIGTTMAFTVGNIIIAHLTLSGFPHKLPTLYLPALQTALFVVVKLLNLVRQDQVGMDVAVNNLVWLGFGVSVGVYGCFIWEIITEISQFLDIWVLSIKHPKGSKSD